jgi:hypothetical protein
VLRAAEASCYKKTVLPESVSSRLGNPPSPIESRGHTLEARSTDPDVRAVRMFGVVGHAVVAAVDRATSFVTIEVAMIADASGAEPTVIVCPAFVWASPAFPNEEGVTPRLGLAFPERRDFIHHSRVPHATTVAYLIAVWVPGGRRSLRNLAPSSPVAGFLGAPCDVKE